MKLNKITLLITLLLTVYTGVLGQHLEIHHINVHDGDATVIRILNDQNMLIAKVLIDGGVSKDYLLNYLRANIDNEYKFMYVILTHYHNDHYNGLTALGDGSIQANYLIDLGAYDLTPYTTNPTSLRNIQPADINGPWSVNSRYLQAIGNAASYYSLSRYQAMNFDEDNTSRMVNTVIPITTIGNIDVKLTCVAAWGFTLGNLGRTIDNWDDRRTSKNNASLAFVLEAGAFRYFLGGDLGGENTGSYIDQETTLIGGLRYLYLNAQNFIDPIYNFPGHVCGFKANHHGSSHSNNNAFVSSLNTAICVTSGGAKHGLPDLNFISYLKNSTPISAWQSSVSNEYDQGFYFTHPSRTSYDLVSFNIKRIVNIGNYYEEEEDRGWSYVITVPINNNLLKTSLFYVKKIDYDGTENPMGQFKCHQQ